SKKGLCTTHYVPCLQGTQYSLLPAICSGGVIALDVLEGSVNCKRFTPFLKHMVLPHMNVYLALNSILVLDNSAIHHGAEISRLCTKHG
ncbi:hypothetical protein CROQUDRAFT_31011, partial [Cronartium quercuum f. sp. fusiforme G11]